MKYKIQRRNLLQACPIFEISHYNYFSPPIARTCTPQKKERLNILFARNLLQLNSIHHYNPEPFHLRLTKAAIHFCLSVDQLDSSKTTTTGMNFNAIFERGEMRTNNVKFSRPPADYEFTIRSTNLSKYFLFAIAIAKDS